MDTETIQIEEFDSSAFSDDQLAAVNDVWNAVDAFDWHPDDPRSPAEETISWYRSTDPKRRWRTWLARDHSGEAVGVGELRWSVREENRHRGRIEVLVAPDARRKGLGRRLALLCAERAPSEELTLIKAHALPDSPGESFAVALGAKRLGTRGDASTEFIEAENRLAAKDVDRNLMESWIQRAADRASDYELVFWSGPTPDDLLEQATRMTNVMNTAPHEEGEEDVDITPEEKRERDRLLEETGTIVWNYAARHKPTGELAGWTNVYPSRYRPALVYQGDTAVDPAHRNKGLGRWLKAAMILKVLDEIPEVMTIETWNATTNEAMLNINHQMGFRRTAVWRSYEIEAEALMRALSE